VNRLIARLAERGVLCSTRDGALRVSFHHYNSAEDVAALLDGIDAERSLLETSDR
jgi:selenocysteine lyase/cysteine desulfurase